MSAPGWIRRLIAFFFPSGEAPAADPDQIFQDAIVETRQKFLDLRATASPLYKARESLRAEESLRQQQIDDAGRRAAELIAAGREKDALRAAAEQGRLEPELEKIRRDLAELERPIAQVEAQLHRIEAKVRDLENERRTSQALLKGADARLAVDRILSSGQLEAAITDIAGAREIVAARLDRARAAEEIAAEETAGGLRALEEDLEGESARARLEAIRTLALPPAKGEGGRE